MLKGYCGKALIVDLDTRRTKVEHLPDILLRQYVGGRALGAKLLYDLLPPKTNPLGPENLLVITTGPVTGIVAPGSSKVAVITKSPATQGFLDSYCSGKVGPELKYAGYDCLILRGKSKTPCILLVEDDTVRILDSNDLWGKDAFEVEKTLTDRYGEEAGKFVIGPAGENQVPFACVNTDYFRQLGRGGIGAVMGSKNLKAIVVKGTGSPDYHDLSGILEYCLKAKDLAAKSEVLQARIKHGTPMVTDITQSMGILPTRNFRQGTFPKGIGKIDGAGMASAAVGTRACLGCLSPCGKIIKLEKEGTYFEGPEYETVGMLGSNLEISDLFDIGEANLLCDKLGLDTISTGVVIGFAMECAELGLLPEAKELGLRFGNVDATLKLIEDIAYRRGLGALLAEGVKVAAERISGGASKFAMHVKGMELPAYDPRGIVGASLTFAVTARGGCHRRCWPPSEAFAGLPPHSYEGKAQFLKGAYDEQCVLHSLISCDFSASGLPFSIDDYAAFLTCITGEAFSRAELIQVAERAETLIRMFNLREGITYEEDTLPARLFDDPLPDGPAVGLSIDRASFHAMLKEYYSLRGWDEKGTPSYDTLGQLGLLKEGGLSA